MTTKKGCLGEVLLLGLGVLIAVVLLEGLVRLARSSEAPKGGYSPVRGHRAKEPVNASGYRDVEHTRTKPPGVHRALFLGDSFTYGAGVLLDDTYAKRTERALSLARSEPWESVVMAVPGINTEAEATILNDEGFAYSPDLVVLGYVLNDAEDAGLAERRRAMEWAEEEGQSPPWWSRSQLLTLIARRLHATSENRRRIENHLALYREGAPGFRAVTKSLGTMAEQCRQRGIAFVIVVFPLFANPLDESYPFTTIHDKVKAACPRGVAIVDLLPYYRDLDWRLLVVEGERDEHPNELAHRIAAQALMTAIQESLSHPRLTNAP